MKTLTLCLISVGFLFAMAHPGQACFCKKHQDKDHCTQAKAVKVQGHPTGPTTSDAVRPSAFGGDKGTLWSLADTVHNR